MYIKQQQQLIAQRLAAEHAAQLLQQKRIEAAAVMQGGVRGRVARLQSKEARMIVEKQEAARQRAEEARRLTEAEEAARLKLIEHRRQIEAQRQADAEKDQHQIYKFALT